MGDHDLRILSIERNQHRRQSGGASAIDAFDAGLAFAHRAVACCDGESINQSGSRGCWMLGDSRGVGARPSLRARAGVCIRAHAEDFNGRENARRGHVL